MDNMDEEYMAAVESGDEQKQREMVKEAASAAGFDTNTKVPAHVRTRRD